LLILFPIDKDLTIKTEEPNDLKFEPKYNYFKSETGNILEIRIEVPGKAKMDANYEVVENETIITFKGNKMKDEEPNRFSDNLFTFKNWRFLHSKIKRRLSTKKWYFYFSIYSSS